MIGMIWQCFTYSFLRVKMSAIVSLDHCNQTLLFSPIMSQKITFPSGVLEIHQYKNGPDSGPSKES